MKKIFDLLQRLNALLITNHEISYIQEQVVTLIASYIDVEVCSLYLFDSNINQLLLKANVGLNPELAPLVQLHPGEGLVGLSFEEGRIIHEFESQSDPHFKPFPGLGEELYPQLLAVPIAFRDHKLGVLTLQTSAKRKLKKEIHTLLSSLSAQLALLLKNVEIYEQLRLMQSEDTVFQDSDVHNKRLKGKGVSPGIVIGHGFFLQESQKIETLSIKRISADEIKKEQKDFEEILSKTQKDLELLLKGIPDKIQGVKEIIEGQLMLLHDPVLRKKISDYIHKNFNLKSALKLVYEEYRIIFNNMEDPYFRERLLDLKDIISRLLSTASSQSQPQLFNDSILIVNEMLPSFFIELDISKIKGIITKKKTLTSHSVILAKTFKIPMITGVHQIFDFAHENDTLILDAKRDEIIINPNEEVLNEYQRLLLNLEKIETVVIKGDPITKDGHFIKLSANLGLLHEIPMVLKSRFHDIGLYRTEFLFLLRKKFPTVAEQYGIYTTILKKLEGKPVTFRILDLGGDKQLSYFPLPQEENPLLGFRSIRIFKKHPQILKDQLKALLMAAFHYECRIMFPLVNNADDLDGCIQILQQAEKELLAEQTPCKVPELGIMIETPASLFNLKHMAQKISFASVGTNDLLQYLLAIDRNNFYSEEYSVFDPGFIQTLFFIGDECRKYNLELNICGEIAGNPLMTPILIGAGFDKLSMVPTSIGSVIETVQKIDTNKIQELCSQVLCLKSAREVETLLSDAYKKHHQT